MVCKTPEELMKLIKLQMFLKDISVTGLGKKLNTSQPNVTKILKTGNPKLETLYQICDALDLDISISPRDTE